MSKPIVSDPRCPKCKSSENLYTIELVEGMCPIGVDEDGTWEFAGYTEMLWDTSQSTELHCGDCGWSVDIPRGKNERELISQEIGAVDA